MPGNVMVSGTGTTRPERIYSKQNESEKDIRVHITEDEK
jgi:hypothetical protein